MFYDPRVCWLEQGCQYPLFGPRLSTETAEGFPLRHQGSIQKARARCLLPKL